MANSLSQDFIDASFGFNSQVLYGAKEPRPLWKRTILALHATQLTQAIGPLYCEEYFNPDDKAKVMEMVGHIREAFRENVQELDWMDQPVKELTGQKEDQITFKMGFPDQWEDVSEVDVRGDTYAANRLALAEFATRRELAKIGKPYDRSEWHMAPTEVNACADLKREMTFPAAILQRPFYVPSRDVAYNYGAIGAVIGHELSHFFDDQGSNYDIEGNLNDWWTEEVKEQFKTRAQKFVKYFGHLAMEGVKVNGELTLGENIADVAGLKFAFAALKKHLAKGDAEPIVDGLTPEQRFFVGFARLWAQKIRPELAEVYALTDPHAPSEVRV
ncbi:MAG TPA: M13 family metallopeptidase, partial [Methylococcales bacterium]